MSELRKSFRIIAKVSHDELHVAERLNHDCCVTVLEGQAARTRVTMLSFHMQLLSRTAIHHVICNMPRRGSMLSMLKTQMMRRIQQHQQSHTCSSARACIPRTHDLSTWQQQQSTLTASTQDRRATQTRWGCTAVWLQQRCCAFSSQDCQ
jgi:hypothetical protein